MVYAAAGGCDLTPSTREAARLQPVLNRVSCHITDLILGGGPLTPP
jgi:hypothetical protein